MFKILLLMNKRDDKSREWCMNDYEERLLEKSIVPLPS